MDKPAVPYLVAIGLNLVLLRFSARAYLDKNQEKIGNTYKVLIDKKDGGYFVGRTEYDSPEVDNEVLIDASIDYAAVGTFVNVKINTAEDFDLYGQIVK